MCVCVCVCAAALKWQREQGREPELVRERESDVVYSLSDMCDVHLQESMGITEWEKSQPKNRCKYAPQADPQIHGSVDDLVEVEDINYIQLAK